MCSHPTGAYVSESNITDDVVGEDHQAEIVALAVMPLVDSHPTRTPALHPPTDSAPSISREKVLACKRED